MNVPGIDLTNRNTQIALGAAALGLGVGAALLSRKAPASIEEEAHPEGCGCGKSSISSAVEHEEADHVHSPSLFKVAYEKVFGAKQEKIEASHVQESSVVEIDTSAACVAQETKRTLFGSLATLAKALVLLPIVVVASAIRAVVSAVSSFVSSIFAKKAQI